MLMDHMQIVWKLYNARNNFTSLQMDVRWTIEPPPSGTPLRLAVPWWNFWGKWRRLTPARGQARTWYERVYVEKPGYWRSEREDGGQSVQVINGDHWWFLTSTNELYTNAVPPDFRGAVREMRDGPGFPCTLAEALADHPCLDPSFLLCFFSLEPLGEDTWAGRPALKIVAVPRGWRKPFASMFYDANEVVVCMDKERGIVLRYELRAEARVLGIIEVLRCVFDQPLPKELFEFPRNIGSVRVLTRKT